MSSGKTLIAVDALGADEAPGVVLDGVKRALNKDKELEVLLVGPEDVVIPFSEENDRCKPLVSEEEISMGEHPAKAVRQKRKSSIVLGCKAKADGFFSGGNTGACLAAATLFTGRIKGVKRPVLATFLPTIIEGKQTLFCDLGANADCKPEYILQFAQMANIILDNKNAKIALLNIGEEDEKGNAFSQECNSLLREKLPNFAGNAQGSDLLTGEFDAIITDGYSGNIALKTVEGTTKSLFKLLKNAMTASLKNKIGALLLKSSLKDMLKKLDPETVGAALLLGVKSVVCIGHGNSSANAICSGILKTAKYARSGIVGKFENEF